MFMSRFVRRTSIALTLGALAATGMLARDAHACGGEWGSVLIREPDLRPRAIPLAEKALEEGRALAAAGIVIRVMPHIRTLDPQSAPIVGRAERVLALALARHDGALAIEREVPDYARDGWDGKDANQRAQNLEWAARSLRKLSDADKTDAALETDLAEVLAKLPQHEKEAQERLERLAARDLVASAEGYKVLAALRSEAGDAKGEKVALVRCRAMAKDKTMCPGGGESAS